MKKIALLFFLIISIVIITIILRLFIDDVFHLGLGFFMGYLTSMLYTGITK